MRLLAGLVLAGLLVSCSGEGSSTDSGAATSPSGTGGSSQALGSTTGTPDSLVCWSAPTSGAPGEIRFEDVTEAFGLVDPLTGLHPHAAALGYVDSDNRPDLMVGTFGDRPPDDYALRGATGPNPDRLLLNDDGFRLQDGWSQELGRTSGALFADLDGDGDDDLVLVRHAGISGDSDIPTRIFENDDGTLKPYSEPLPIDFRGRTPTAADFDGDGLLDLYISEDRFGDRGGLLLHNEGSLDFTDVTSGSGLEGVFSLSAMAADLNGDGRPDLTTSRAVFINDGGLRFHEVTPDGYVPEPVGEEDDPAGVAVGDLNRDGLPEIVVGQHYRATIEFDSEIPIHLFLNRGLDADGNPTFEDVTETAGLTPLPTLAPHVQISDLDNDGWPDIVTSASAADGSTVAVFHSLGGQEPRFETSPGLGSDQYWVGAPTADVGADGRLDVLAVEWEPSLPSLLLRNVGDSGHWLEVSVGLPGGGVGSHVTVSDGDGNLVGSQEITAGGGYASGTLPVAHFGLGASTSATVSIELPDGTSADLGRVGADQHLRWPSGCSS